MIEDETIVPILIVNYNGRSYLEDCLRSVFDSFFGSVRPVIYIVDNASSDDSVSYLKSAWPDVRLIESRVNLGYAGGNNLGWRVIRQELPHAPYIFLLNQDTIVDSAFLEPLVAAMHADRSVGAAQPLLLLHPETDRINSMGNVIHYLGFGYSRSNGTPLNMVASFPEGINYASGAAVLLRVAAVDKAGLFDDFMFMYLEDLDLGWRLMLHGWKSVLVPSSKVYHKYEFKRGMRQYYFFERNRLWIVFKNYRVRTLVLLVPALLLMEIAQLTRAVVQGTVRQKLRGYAYFLNPMHVRTLLRDRRILQRSRVVADRKVLAAFSGRIDFQPLEGPLLRYVANPVFSAYRALLRIVIVW